MEFLQAYGKELVSLAVPLITWLLNRVFKARAQLRLASPHAFTFLIPHPLLDQQGAEIAPRQTIHTRSFIIQNAGKETATKVELVFNWKPPCVNIWPSRHFVEHNEPDGRYIMVFDSLAPSCQRRSESRLKLAV